MPEISSSVRFALNKTIQCKQRAKCFQTDCKNSDILQIRPKSEIRHKLWPPIFAKMAGFWQETEPKSNTTLQPIPCSKKHEPRQNSAVMLMSYEHSSCITMRNTGQTDEQIPDWCFMLTAMDVASTSINSISKSLQSRNRALQKRYHGTRQPSVTFLRSQMVKQQRPFDNFYPTFWIPLMLYSIQSNKC